MRPSWDDYFINIARVVSTRSTCSRLQVGAVIVDSENHIISTGYNNAPAGQPHCDHVCICPWGDDDPIDHPGKCPAGKPCAVAVHSEANALKYAPEQVYFSESGYTMYCTHSPCSNCVTEILDHGIGRVVFLNPYRDTAPLDRLRGQGVIVQHYEGG